MNSFLIFLCMIDKRKFYINGAWVNPIIKNDFKVINPSNEQSYANISLGSKKDVDLAVIQQKMLFYILESMR